jgi:hypothetical protein
MEFFGGNVSRSGHTEYRIIKEIQGKYRVESRKCYITFWGHIKWSTWSRCIQPFIGYGDDYEFVEFNKFDRAIDWLQTHLWSETEYVAWPQPGDTQ